MKLGSFFALCLALAIKRVASAATVPPPTTLIRTSVAAANRWWVSLNLTDSRLSPEPPAGTLTGAIECRGSIKRWTKRYGRAVAHGNGMTQAERMALHAAVETVLNKECQALKLVSARA